MAATQEPEYEKFEGDELDDTLLNPAAALFSSNYGVWGPLAAQNMGPWAKQGNRVRMTVQRLRTQCIPQNPSAHNTYIRAMIGGRLAGNVFATRWVYEGRNMCWITQLVVDSEYRGRGLATTLLQELRKGEKDLGCGILSSHPAAIRACLRAFGRSLAEVELVLTRDHAAAIMQTSPVDYVKSATLRGSFFGQSGYDVVCCADTSFWVDHEEPLAALERVRREGIEWPFGDLPEGHGYLVLVKAKS